MTVAAAISDSTSDREVVREGWRLAERLGDPLYVVTVMEISDFVDIERTSVESTGRGVEVEDVKTMAKDLAEEIADAAIEDEYTYKVRAFVGDPIDGLNNFADENDVDYLVIGGRRRTPIGKLIFGSTAQSILLNYDRPIVSVRIE